MRYRWKLLILLLIISLLPILVMRTFGMRIVRHVKDIFISQTHDNLIGNAESRLQLIADAYSLVLWKGREQVEAVLLAQVLQTETILGVDAPMPSKVYFADDFRAGTHLPDDAFPSSFHFRYGRGGQIGSLNVSFGNQVFKLAPGTDGEVAAADIARLSKMNTTLKKLSKRLESIAFWHTTSLKNGLYSSYPGHGGIPRGFDPRQQPWFKLALEDIGHPWSTPFVDPVTRQVVIAASMPVRRPDGEIAGVTSIVVPIGSLLEHPLLARNIPPASRLFMSYLTKQKESGQMGALIVARDEHTDVRHRSWRVQIEPDWLVSEDKEEFQAMLGDIEAGKSNIRRMRFENCDCLWVYGQASNQAFFVLITPYEEILKPVQQAASLIQGRIDSWIQLTRYGLSGLVIFIIVLALVFSRTVTKPVWALVEGAKQLAAGNFDTRVDIRSRDEFGMMGKVFNSMGPELKEKRMMRQSLEIAREVQRKLLPKSEPVISGLDVAGSSIYCDQTGGDYYDFIDTAQYGNGRLAVVVGDVSGHGIPSALLMTTARAFLRQRAAMPGDIGQILADANVQLVRDIEDSGSFITLFYSVFDVNRKSISWVRAGHDPALVYDTASKTFDELGGQGLPLGIFREVDFEMQQRQISAGQIFIIGTDGIWEACNQRREMFGKEKFRHIIRENADKPAQTIVTAIIDAVTAFRQPLKQEDDITLVVVKVEI